MKNNKGFTLVELLVTMAIIGVVSTGATMGYNSMHRANVTNAANSINSYMASIRMNNMSKVQMQYLHLYRYKDDYYYSIDNNKRVDFTNLDNKIGNASNAVFYQTNTERVITNNNGITITYNRAGECKLYSQTGGAITQDLKSITFTRADKKVIIRVLPAIGKSYIE